MFNVNNFYNDMLEEMLKSNREVLCLNLGPVTICNLNATGVVFKCATFYFGGGCVDWELLCLISFSIRMNAMTS